MLTAPPRPLVRARARLGRQAQAGSDGRRLRVARICSDAAGGAAPSIPDVKWDDVGGLEDVKATLLDTIELPLKCEIF
jgi:hypothetical protein